MITRRALAVTGGAALAGAGVAFAQQHSAGAAITAVDVHPSDYPTVEAVRWMGEEIAREIGFDDARSLRRLLSPGREAH